MKYYIVDSRRLSFADYWHLVSPATVLIPWAAKLFGMRINFGAPNPQPECFENLAIDPFDLTAAARQQLVPAIDALRALGFQEPLFQHLPCPDSTGDNGAVAMLDGTRSVIAKVLWSKTMAAGVMNETLAAGLLSKVENGDWIETTNARHGFAPLPWMRTARQPGASVTQLWEVHTRRLETLSRTTPVCSLRTAAEHTAFLDELETRAFREQLARGVFVEVSDVERPAMPASAATAAVGGA